MIINACVCIPTFNNNGTIQQVVNDILSETELPIIVFDDGSHTPIEKIIKEHSRVTILRNSKNLGKGATIEKSFQFAAKLGYTHLITMDGDGQHYAREIKKLLALVTENPFELIIGNRKLVGEDVPEISKFGRKFSNFWVDYQTGYKISDSQSGFRTYPVFLVQNMTFFTKRYDFEIEVMIKLLWKGIKIKEVEIDVFYPEESKRISHFDKLWDNVRISILNTVLVVLSLLKTHRKPFKVSIALAVGVFVGTTPFIGLHALIVAVISFIFRLNYIVLLIGTQISIPPLMPILIYTSVLLGHIVLGQEMLFSADDISLAFAQEKLGVWLLGSSILGGALATLTFIISYFITKKINKPVINWNGKSRGGAIGNMFMKSVTKYLGLKAAYSCLFFITPYFYFFSPKGRNASLEYWKIIRPNLNFWKYRWLVLRHYYRFGTLLIDRMYQSASDKNPFKTHENGIENITAILGKQQNGILLSAHVGNWSISAEEFRDHFKQAKINMIEHKSNKLKLINDTDKQLNKDIKADDMSKISPLMEINAQLNNHHSIVLMGDRPLGEHFELITFCEKLVPFDSTPFRIAAMKKLPLVFTFAFKGKDENYDFYADVPVKYNYQAGVNKRQQVRVWMQDFSKTLEKHIKNYPDQWCNFYPVWSSIPDHLPR